MYSSFLNLEINYDMIKKTFPFLFFILFICSNAFCLNDIGFTKQNEPIKIVFIGDSITYGSGVGDRNKYTYPAHPLRVIIEPKMEVNIISSYIRMEEQIKF